MIKIPESPDALPSATGVCAFCEQGRIVLEFMKDGNPVMEGVMTASEAIEIAGRLHSCAMQLAREEDNRFRKFIKEGHLSA